MCFRYTAKKTEARIQAREKQFVFGMVPRENIRPTDLGPILLPDDDDLLAQGRGQSSAGRTPSLAGAGERG